MGRRGQEGFSLIEMLVVLVILSLLAAGGLNHWPAAFHLHPGAEQVVRDLRLAQAMAMNRSASILWRRTGVSSYALEDDVGTPLLGFQVEGISLGGASTVRFDRRGISVAGGAVTLNAEGQSVTVTVDAGTGTVRLP